MNQKCQIYSIKIYAGKKKTNFQQQNLREEKKTPNLQHQNLREKNICQIYNINIYMKKTPNLQHQNLREKKNAKFTTSKFTWERKTPNLQHQNLREEKKRQIYNINIYVEKKR